MTQSHRDFWEMERRNRRQTIALVIAFLLLFCALGFGLDLVIGTLRVRHGQLTGFPVLTLLALCVGAVQSLVSYYGGSSLVLMSAHAHPAEPGSPTHQMGLEL